jgi:hypothetical protein
MLATHETCILIHKNESWEPDSYLWWVELLWFMNCYYYLKVNRAGPFCGFAGLAVSAANISEVSQSVSCTLLICVWYLKRHCSNFKGELVKFVSVTKYFETVVGRAPRVSARLSCLVLGRSWIKISARKSRIPFFVSFAVFPSRWQFGTLFYTTSLHMLFGLSFSNPLIS